MTSVHSCVRWCFALKGQCQKIFSFRYFSWIILPQPLKIRKVVDSQNVLHLLTFHMSGNLEICELQTDPIFFVRFANFRFADPIFVAVLKLPQIFKFFIFLFTNTYLKCANSNFYQIKNSAKQTCSWLLYSFAIKRGNFFKRCLILSVL